MGPLAGLKIVELAGIGPAPFCGMMLSDMGAEVIRVDRASGVSPGVHLPRQYNVLGRGRKSIAVDLKQASGVETVLRLVEQAEAFIEELDQYHGVSNEMLEQRTSVRNLACT